nr:MAG TPA: hypothetical protein [Caudoviricetes sp.]DAS96742.1 MAG TPA: hypothetical protein [Caudoviricetes sp.]
MLKRTVSQSSGLQFKHSTIYLVAKLGPQIGLHETAPKRPKRTKSHALGMATDKTDTQKDTS